MDTVTNSDKSADKSAAAEQAQKEVRALRRQRRERKAQRQMLVYVFTLVGLLLLYALSRSEVDTGMASATNQQVVLRDASRSMLRDEKKSIVEDFAEMDERESLGQRDLVSALTRRHVGVSPSGGGLGDLVLLQKILDQGVLENDQAFELQALGVTLGDVMARQLGLEWVVVNDEYGRTRALQYGTNEDVFFPITMISRRYEADIFVDVEALYAKMAAEVEALRPSGEPHEDFLRARRAPTRPPPLVR